MFFNEYSPSAVDIEALKSRSSDKEDSIECIRLSGGPALRPAVNGGVSHHYWRTGGAFSTISIDGAPMLFNLSHGQDGCTLLETERILSTRYIRPTSKSVLEKIHSDALWHSISNSVRCGYKMDDAEAQKFVSEGRHLEGLVYRLVAFAVESVLCPFSTHLRAANASACYWYLPKMRNDNVTFSIQNVNGLHPFISPQALGMDADPVFVVWCDTASLTKGMALLACLCDAGGPVADERVFLLRNESVGKVLLAGVGILCRNLPNVAAHDFREATEEALRILTIYNGVTGDMISRAFDVVVQNLPVVDLALFRERQIEAWAPALHKHAEPVLGDAARAAALAARVDNRLGRELLAYLAGDDAQKRERYASMFFSHADRRQIYAPTTGTEFAPETYHSVGAKTAYLLAVMAHKTTGIFDGTWATVWWDLEQPRPMAAFSSLPKVSDLFDDGIGGVWAGRNIYQLYVLLVPPSGDKEPEGFSRLSEPKAELIAMQGNMPGTWYQWNVELGDSSASAFPLSPLLSVVTMRVPLTANSYPWTYTPPAGRLGKFDEEGATKFGMSRNGDMQPRSWTESTQRFLDIHASAESPLQWLLPGTPRPYIHHTAAQRTALMILGLGALWDAKHKQTEENDAWIRYIRTNTNDCVLTSIPAHGVVYLGGVRVQLDVMSAGGLWTLCYQKVPDFYRYDKARLELTSAIYAREAFWHHLLKVRACVDMGSLVMRLSNACVEGCVFSMPVDVSLDKRMEKLQSLRLTSIPAQVALQQLVLYGCGVLGGVHGLRLLHPSVFPRGGLRVRELRSKSKQTDTYLVLVQRCNWVITQVLPSRVVSFLLGVAEPTKMVNSVGREVQRSAKYADGWSDVGTGLMHEGLLLDPQDEIPIAVVDNLHDMKSDLVSVFLKDYGPSYEIAVHALNTVDDAAIAPFAMRLALPLDFERIYK